MVIKFLELIVIKAHYIQKKDIILVPKDQLDLLNAIKLVIIELVNNHVDDMIRIIMGMKEKAKDVMV